MLNRSLFSAFALLVLVSCGSLSQVNTTSTYQKLSPSAYITPIQADLEVSSKRINYFMLVSKTVGKGGLDNVISTAVKEALDANGSGDVLVNLQTQVKYADNGDIESINVTGFPASYVNFRSNDNLPMAGVNANDLHSSDPQGRQGLFNQIIKKK